MTNKIKFLKKGVSIAVTSATILWSVGISAFVPMATHAATAGQLIKMAGNPAVYYLGSDSKRYVFPNSTTYFTWYADFSGVVTISSSELQSYAIGGNVTMRSGTKLAKITTDPKVYAVEPGGKLRWIETEAIAKTLFGDNWAQRVVDVPDAFFVNYTVGTSINTNSYPTGTLIKSAASSDVYYVDGTTKKKVTSAGLTANNFNTANVVTSTDTVFNALTAGSEIAALDTTIWNVAGGASVATGGTASVALAADTPASTSIADAGNANFTKFTVTTGETAVTLNSITITRYGLTSNADLENVKILDADGVNMGNSATFNSDNRAKVTFNPALSLAANSSTSFFIRAGIVDGTTGGKTVQLGIASASDISSSATFSGTFPIVGNSMSTVAVTIGSLSVTYDGTVTDNTPDVGDVNVTVNKWKMTVGSTEAVTVEQISVERQGSASATDTKNIELWDVTHAKSLGEVASWNSQGLAVFKGLNLVLAKGETLRLEVRLDVVSGVGLTVNADVTDGSDVRVTVKGNDFGFYLTPSVTGSWIGQGGTTTATNQTISSAALTIAKSSSTPATGNITKGNERLISVLDVIVDGEPARVTSFKVAFDLVGGGPMADTELSNARIKNYTTGESLGGPNTVGTTDYTANGTTYEATATFTDTIEFPVGTTKVGIYVDIASSVSANDTVVAGMADPDSDITAKGTQSNDSITAAPAASTVNGNTQTVKGAALASTTLTQPVANNVVKGTQDKIWSIFDLSAANSGEDVNVTAVVLEDTLGDAADDAGTIDNVELWADLTSENSARGDQFETLISSTKQFADSGAGDETLSVPFTTTVVVKKDTSVRVAVIADLAAGATTGDTHTISLDTDASDVTANGANTGDAVTTAPTGAGQTQAVVAQGALTVSVNSSSPTAGVMLDGGQGGKELLGVFRLAANSSENLELDSFMITDDGSDDDINTYYFQATTKTGTALGPEKPVTGGGTATAYWSDGEVSIPLNDYILVKVSGTILDIDSVAIQNGDTVVVTVAADNTDVATTGLASGTTINGGGSTNYDAAAQTIYESYPSFAWDMTTPTVLNGSTAYLGGKLKVIAVGDKDVTFETADGNLFILQVTVTGDDTAGTEAITLKDADGNTLDSGTITSASGTTEITMNFSTADETVAAGATTYWYFYTDVSDLEDDGNTFQLWLDDTAGDLDFGVNGANFANSVGNIIFRGDLFGPSSVNPS